MARDERVVTSIEPGALGLVQRAVPVRTGVTLNVVERVGDGAPVLCVHGLWGTWRSWRALVAPGPGSFSGRRLLMIDLRGHGDSSKPGAGYRLSDYAADLVAFVREEGLTGLTLAGHSLGTLVSLAAAPELAQQVEALLLEDPPLPLPDGFDNLDEVWLSFYQSTRGLFMLKHEPFSLLVEALQDWNPEAPLDAVEAFAATIVDTANGVFEAILTGHSVDIEIPQRGVTLDLPALVIQPGNSSTRMLRELGIAQLRAALPRLRLEIIPDANHDVLRSNPTAYRSALATFFGA